MIRRPPRSTLFPTRRSSDLPRCLSPGPSSAALVRTTACLAHRSEEHTSELQSLAYIVCRLLLEKKIDARHVDDGAAEPVVDHGCDAPPCHAGSVPAVGTANG